MQAGGRPVAPRSWTLGTSLATTDGVAHAHGLERRQAVALRQGDVGKGPGALVQPGQDGVRDRTGEDHPVRQRGVDGLLSPARRAHDDQRPAPGQRRPHLPERTHQPVQVLPRLESAHGQEEFAGHADPAQQLGRGVGIGIGHVLGAPRHQHQPGRLHAARFQVGGHQARRHDQCRRRGSGVLERLLVPAPAPGRGGVGMPAPGHVVHRDHEPAAAPPTQHGRGEGHRVHDVEPVGRAQPAAVPCPRHERSWEMRRHDRFAELSQRIGRRSGAPTRRPAGQEGQRDLLSHGGLRFESGQQAPGVGPDAAGHPAPQLLDRDEDRAGRLRHRAGHPGTAVRARRRSGPTRSDRPRTRLRRSGAIAAVSSSKQPSRAPARPS